MQLTERNIAVAEDVGRSVVGERVIFGVRPSQFHDNMKKREPWNCSFYSIPG